VPVPSPPGVAAKAQVPVHRVSSALVRGDALQWQSSGAGHQRGSVPLSISGACQGKGAMTTALKLKPRSMHRVFRTVRCHRWHASNSSLTPANGNSTLYLRPDRWRLALLLLLLPSIQMHLCRRQDQEPAGTHNHGAQSKTLSACR